MTPADCSALFDAPASARRRFTPAERLGELTLEVAADGYLDACRRLRDAPELRFEQLIDLCGMDYSAYGDRRAGRARVSPPCCHLLSVTHNGRLRVRVLLPRRRDAAAADRVTEIWPSANWYEREAFDLFGIMFDGHPDLRRILTDYGFVGHPFRKDFPLSGYVEMRYDPEQQRVDLPAGHASSRAK